MEKADDKVTYDDNEMEDEKYSNFEKLQVEVEVLKETVYELVRILRENNLHRTEKIVPEYFDDEEVSKRLNEEY